MPVVLIPGQLLTERLWRPQIAVLGPDVEVASPEATTHDTIAAMAQAVLADAPPRFVLAGHAMGGFVAFEILRVAPQRVTRLLLMSTLARADTPEQTRRREGYLRLVEDGRFAEVAESRLPILLGPDRPDDPNLVAAIRQMAADTGPAGFLRQQRAIMSRPDSRPTLGAIGCPTLILFGRDDGIVTLEHQAEMRDAIRGARLEILDGCGHLMTLQRPAEVNALVGPFLSDP